MLALSYRILLLEFVAQQRTPLLNDIERSMCNEVIPDISLLAVLWSEGSQIKRRIVG